MTAAATDWEGKRIALVREKLATDERIRRLRDQLQYAHARAATRGIYLDSVEHHRLKSELSKSKSKSQRLQLELTELNRARKAQVAP